MIDWGRIQIRAVAYHGKRDVRVDTVPDPSIEQPTDAIVRVTSSGICGSDLHLYEVLGAFIDEGDILGHEPMGIVQEVGSEVKHIKPGDRVVIPFNISCGHCFMCDRAAVAMRDDAGPRVRERGPRCLATPSSTARSRVGRRSFCACPRLISGRSRFRRGRRTSASSTSPTSPDRLAGGGVRRDPEGGTVAVFGLGPIGEMSSADRPASRSGERCSAIDLVPERLEHGAPPRRRGVDLSRMTTICRWRCAMLTDGRGPDRVIDAVGMEAHGAPLGSSPRSSPACSPTRSLSQDDRKAGVDRLSALHASIDARPARRHDLALRRLRGRGRPDATHADVRQADPAADGPGERQALDRRDHAAARGRTIRSASTTSPPTSCRSSKLRTRTRSSRRRKTERSRSCCNQTAADPVRAGGMAARPRDR